MRVRLGKDYQVVGGSGLNSGRIGMAVPWHKYTHLVNSEQGRYKPFNPDREAVLLDDDGNIFTMFKNRLVEVGL